MAQELLSINLVAPAFKGINTEDTPLAQDPSFAEKADNAVIDERGRIASRKGIALATTDSSELGSDRIHKVHHFYDSTATEVTFSAGNNKILSGTTTLVDVTPAGYTITDNNWKIINFNDNCYFFQRGYEPLVYNNTLGAVTVMSAVPGASLTTAQYCHEAIGAYGRLWVVGTETNKNIIYWSDLLTGQDFAGGSSGSINVEEAWPDGFDEVRGLAAHNNLLIVFGEHSSIIYQDAQSPANMSIADTVPGVGCICRNSIQHIGTDVLFLSHSGLRSFQRTIQEKSMPITDLSRNVKQELIQAIESRTEPTASVYSPENYFYLATFPDQLTTYCFDLRGTLENGSYRVTKWPSSLFKAWHRKTDGELLTGTQQGIGSYFGYLDQTASYRFSYFSPGLTFGDPSKIKILKKLRPTLIGVKSANIILKWAYDLNETYTTQEYTIDDPTSLSGEYNVSEYNIGEYSRGTLTVRKAVNTTGNGTIITIGLESDINGSALSLQEINVQALMGKTI